jgi:hypothetical protein
MVNITKDDRVKKFSEEDEEEEEDDYEPAEDRIRVRRKEEPKQREEEVRRASQRYEEPRDPVKEVSGDKFEAFHQPEVVGIRDKDTDEVIVLFQAQTLVDKVGEAIFKAKELSHLDAIRKSV